MTAPDAHPFRHPKRPNIVPPVARRTEIDDYIPRKSQPMDATEAFAKLAAKDFEPYKGEWGAPEQDAAIELLCRMCGMKREECYKGTLKSLRAASRWLLNNITSLEAEGAFSRMDAKSTDWYKKRGQPMGAAQWLVNETSRMKSEQAKENGDKYLSYLQTQPDQETGKDVEEWDL